jgi:hypothetical protein
LFLKVLMSVIMPETSELIVATDPTALVKAAPAAAFGVKPDNAEPAEVRNPASCVNA